MDGKNKTGSGQEGRGLVVSIEKTLTFMTALENKHVHPSFVDAWLELRRTLESYLPQEEEEQQEDVSDEEYEDEVEEVKVPIKEKPREVVVTPREPPKISRFVKKEVTDDDLLL